MKTIKKIITSLIILTISAFSIWALPGFESFIPDTSGEFVYYKDNTFFRESYIGILYYNEETVQIRYYAPTAPSQKLPENEINILVSIDPESSHWEMTGENILSTITPNTDDVEIVNYLHDMLYEFSAHRILVEDLNDRNIEIAQDFTQFGGDVVMNYDCTIPLFNIKEIKNYKDEKLLECVTVGKLADNSDTSFDDFKGLPESSNKKSRKHYKRAKSQDVTFGTQSITLDSGWTQKMDNLWIMNNDDSLLTLNTTTVPPLNDNSKIENYLIKFFTEKGQNTYLVYDSLVINDKNNRLEIQAETYNPETKKTVVNKIIISPNKDPKLIDFLTMATYKEPWLKNAKYYNKIIESYKN